MAIVLPTVAPRRSLLALERIPAPIWVIGLLLLAMPAFASNFVLFQIFGWSFILGHDRPVADGAGRLWRHGEPDPDVGGGTGRLRGGDPRHQRRTADQPGLAVVAAHPARDPDRDPVRHAGRCARGSHRGHLHDHDHAGDRGGVLLLHAPELRHLQRLHRLQQRRPTGLVRHRLAPGGTLLLSDARLRDAVLPGGRMDGAHAVRAGAAGRARQPAAHECARLFGHDPSHSGLLVRERRLRRSAASCSSGRTPRSCLARPAFRR